MQVILTILSVYSLYVLVAGVIVIRTQKRDRFSSFMIAVSFPLILLLAPFHILLSGSKFEMKPCPPGLEEAEALVERKRQIIFSALPIEPTIAKSWKKHYAMSVELQARQLRKISIHVKDALAAV
jgi:hypothetical protein